MPIVLCCLLWATPGNRSALHACEDSVLVLLRDHDATIIQRAVGVGDGDTPGEVQIYEFPSQAALDDYLADPRQSLSVSGSRQLSAPAGDRSARLT